MENLILGAGPTGIGAAYELDGKAEYLVLEKESTPGGLSSSFVDDNGFTWDIGGHVQFSHYKTFDEAMVRALGADGWLTHERESWAWMEERFVPYPVQNNLRYLTKESTWNCIRGFLNREKEHGNADSAPTHFKEWILRRFGTEFAALFMTPYNTKVWAFPPEQMHYGWIGERVATPSVERILENIILSKDDLSWGPNATFKFPKSGGTGAIWTSLASQMGQGRFRYWSEVKSIHTGKREVTLKSGERFRYKNLLSTLPIPTLVKMLEPAAPPEVLEWAQQFLFSTSNIVGIGLRGQPSEALRKKCWMYFPEKNCPFYRVTVFSNYSPRNVPDPATTWSLMTETSESRYKPQNAATLVEDTIQGLLNTKQIESRDQILSTWTYRAPFGYPTPFVGRDSLLEKVIPWLESVGISSRGRFGGWKYEVSNQDHSFMQGVEWGRRVLKGEKEVTFFDPAAVNG